MDDQYKSVTLVLIRHAQARSTNGSYGRDTPLSNLGRKQADALASFLAGGEPIAEVYSSPLPRAIETARPLCERLGLEAITDSRLIEFELTTISVQSIEERQDLQIWRPEQTASDGETLREFSARVAAFCDEVAEKHLGTRIAVVAHAGTIDAALRWSLNMPPDSPWQHEFDIANASITEVDFWPRGRVKGGAPRFALLRRIVETAQLGGLITDI